MPFIRNSFNFGKTAKGEFNEEFVRVLEEYLETISRELNQRTDFVTRSVAPNGTPDANGNIPSITDINYRNGTIWIVQNGVLGPITDEVYIKTDTISSGGNNTALWVRLG